MFEVQRKFTLWKHRFNVLGTDSLWLNAVLSVMRCEPYDPHVINRKCFESGIIESNATGFGLAE